MYHTFIDDFIKNGQTETFSLKNFYETKLITNGNRDHYYDFFLEHYKEFEKEIQFYSLSQHMFYRPKTLSYDIYGTTEMWLPILHVNEMISVAEFHKPIIKVYNPNTIFDLISIWFKREGKN